MTSLSELEITDAHHHLWDLQANYYPWLTDRVEPRVCGDYAAIRHDYLLADFFTDAQGLNLVRSVHIEAVIDRRDPVRETRWLQALAESEASRGFPHAIVAFCDLASPEAPRILESHRRSPNLRGIRHMLHEAVLDPAAPREPLYLNPVWRANLARLAELDLSFELQVYPEQMEDARTVVAENPRVRFVLCHTGQPAVRSEPGLALWREGMRRLAEMPNVWVKISGLGMFERNWSVASLRPLVLETIDIFGTERAMFGSNFPVDGMMTTYRRLWEAYDEITREAGADERRRLFSATARAFYRI